MKTTSIRTIEVRKIFPFIYYSVIGLPLINLLSKSKITTYKSNLYILLLNNNTIIDEFVLAIKKLHWQADIKSLRFPFI